MRRTGLLVALVLLSKSAFADDVLKPGQPKLDPPTLVALGVQLPITADDNHNATVTMRYRPMGQTAWKDAMPLYRVRPETVPPPIVPIQQFAGSIFDLRPDTMYEIELHAKDADGNVDQTLMLSGRTRAVPRDPMTPKMVSVNNTQTLNAALAAAKAGDVITLAAGTYNGQFALNASGTADNPIVVRGVDRDTVVLDGGNCNGCNVFEAYGSFVHIEKLTIQNASRALRFQGAAAQGNVVRRVKIQNVILGIGSKQDQRDFYLCDNVLKGRLSWPAVYADDGGQHANDDGIHVEGFGHVVCHNALEGFGDAMKTEQNGARSIDFYGNEVTSAYDNGLELDGAEGNVRALRNRFTNTYATISVQPVYGGPAYIVRNVVVNVANEQMKFHGLGNSDGPSGVLVHHNTFVSPNQALGDFTTAACHHFEISNNLFVGPAMPAGKVVEWDAPTDDGLFDFNGYFPDGKFTWNKFGAGYQNYNSFSAAQMGGWEKNGLVLSPPIFMSGLVAPASYKTTLVPQDVTLAPGSNAIDKGKKIANLNDDAKGNGPDLGAYEIGCPAPTYGPRADGVDESNEMFCGSTGMPAEDGSVVLPDGAVIGGDGGPKNGNSGSGGCGCNAAPAEGGAATLAIGLLLAIRRRCQKYIQ